MKLIGAMLFCMLTGLFATAQDTINPFEKRVAAYLMLSKFEKEISYLLTYSDDDFKYIKGEAIKNDAGLPPDFKSTLRLDGATDSRITTGVWTRFVASFPPQKDSAAAFNAFNKISASIKKGMGDITTVKVTPLQQTVSGFDVIKVQVAEFRKFINMSKSYAYYTELKIYRSASKMKLFSSAPDWRMELAVYKKFE